MTPPPRADRQHELEQLLGDPFDATNPLGFTNILAADEAGSMFAAGEQALTRWGLNLEFVPTELGGRLSRLDDLVEIMRSVYRRDPCLGLGYGASSFIAGVNIWAAGSAEQRRRAADLLAAGRRISVAYHELAHGNDMAETECRADVDGGELRLNGRKEVVTNLERSEAFVLFARTSAKAGARSHSQLFVDKAELHPAGSRYLPRFHTAGMRGVELGGIEFDDCRVPASTLMGTPGTGLENALRSFQVTRTTLVAMFNGVLDTGIRTALRHTTRRRLYGGSAIDLPHVRAVIAGARADLLAADCFAAVAARALHVVPEEAAIYAQAVKFFVPKILIDAMNDLAGVLGAHFYLRDGEAAIFQKLLRDIQPAGFGHAARAACQVSLFPRLPLLARRSWSQPRTLPDNVFAPDAELPPFDFAALGVGLTGQESLATSLALGLAEVRSDGDVSGLVENAEYFVAELAALTRRCEGLDIAGLGIAADPAVYEFVERYARVLVASACFETWRRSRNANSASFTADARWPAAVLHRLRAAAEVRPRSLPPDLTGFLVEEAMSRLRSGRGFGLAAPSHL